MRFELFAQNKAGIEKLNKEQTHMRAGLNKFSDWTPEEKAKLQGLTPLKNR